MMASRLNDFLKPRLSGMDGDWDLDALGKIPKEEFRRMYIEDMQNYIDNHPRSVIGCTECQDQITSPDDMVRRYGLNLHKDCFKSIYSRERYADKPSSQEFFDLVFASLE